MAMPSGKTTLLIHQPYFLPWLGFLAKLNAADRVLVLDRAPFRRNHLSRVRVLEGSGRLLWLTYPVGASQGQLISEVLLPDDRTIGKRLLRTLRVSYGRSPYFRREVDFVEELFAQSSECSSLSEFTVSGIEGVLSYLGLHCEVILESQLDLPTDRTDKAMKAAELLGAQTIVCGDGASTTVHDMNVIQASCDVAIIRYASRHPVYPQLQRSRANLPFAAGLSFVDALFQTGREGVVELLEQVPVEPWEPDAR